MSVWSSLVGQDHVVATLSQAARDPRAMTHAWLFTGPPGSGRSVAARAFAATYSVRSSALTRIGCAAGAATRPPTPAFSSTMAITTLGASAGAKAWHARNRRASGTSART